MALRLIPHIHRATHRIGMHIAGLDDPSVNQAEAHVLAHLASAGESTIGQVHRAFGHKRSTLTSILDILLICRVDLAKAANEEFRLPQKLHHPGIKVRDMVAVELDTHRRHCLLR